MCFLFKRDLLKKFYGRFVHITLQNNQVFFGLLEKSCNQQLLLCYAGFFKTNGELFQTDVLYINNKKEIKHIYTLD